MSRIAPSNTGRTPMERLMGHAPHILDPWTKLEDAFFASKTFSPTLLEQVRRTLALGTGCRYCQSKGGPPHQSHADPRTAAAVELAEHFARDHRSIDEAVLARARDHFADAELCELLMFMRSEEHTSELQSRLHLVCRLLLEKKKKRRERELCGRSLPEAGYAAVAIGDSR